MHSRDIIHTFRIPKTYLALTLKSAKKALIALTVVFIAVYALRFVASAQVARAFAQCAKASNPTAAIRESHFRNAESLQAYAGELLACTDRQRGWLSRLFYSHDDLTRGTTITHDHQSINYTGR